MKNICYNRTDKGKEFPVSGRIRSEGVKKTMKYGESSYRRFLDGDPDAFDEIWKEHRLHLTFFIDRYVNDPAVAEDIAIDVFTYVLVHPRRYNFKTALKTYLFMLGRSRALDYLRRRKRIEFVDLSVAHGAEDSSQLEDAVLGEDRKIAVSAALAQLTPPMREAVHLVYFEQLSYEEAARVMKKDKKQIDNLLYRAKGQLREILGKEPELL